MQPLRGLSRIFLRSHLHKAGLQQVRRDKPCRSRRRARRQHRKLVVKFRTKVVLPSKLIMTARHQRWNKGVRVIWLHHPWLIIAPSSLHTCVMRMHRLLSIQCKPLIILWWGDRTNWLKPPRVMLSRTQGKRAITPCLSTVAQA